MLIGNIFGIMHHMIEEIRQEIDLFSNYTSPPAGTASAKEVISNAKTLDVSGNGASYNAAVYLSILLSKQGVHSRPIFSSELGNWVSSGAGKDDVLVIFSQSGESADAIVPAKEWKKSGKRMIGITNNRESSIASLSDSAVYTDAGDELSLTATKTHITQLLASIWLSEDDDSVARSEIAGAMQMCKLILESDAHIRELAKRLRECTIFLGSGLLYPIALEAAIQLKETTGKAADACPPNEYVHGPQQVLNNNWSVVLLSDYPDVEHELRGYTDYVINIRRFLKEKYNIELKSEVSDSIVKLFTLQLIAYYRTVDLGLDPDHPSRLIKVRK